MADDSQLFGSLYDSYGNYVGVGGTGASSRQLDSAFPNPISDYTSPSSLQSGLPSSPALQGNLSQQNNGITVADATSIQPALDTLRNAGGGVLFLKTGTYYMQNNIIVPSNVIIEGILGGTVIDFGSAAYQIQISGTNSYTTGTLSATYNSTSVTGVGTTWTNAMIGRSILIGSFWYTISAVGSTTTITLSSAFSEATVSGKGYAIATTVNNVEMNNVTVQNSSTDLIVVNYANTVVFNDVSGISGTSTINSSYTSAFVQNNCFSSGCGKGFYLNYWQLGFSLGALVEGTTSGAGISVLNSYNCTLFEFAVVGAAAGGVYITNTTNFAVEIFSIDKTAGIGLELAATCSYAGLVNGYVANSSSDGIKFTATSTDLQVIGSVLNTNGGYGVNVTASSDNRVIISSSDFVSNSSGAVNDSGTGTIIRGNSGVADNSVDVQIFTGNGTWTKPSGVGVNTQVVVQCWGAGGGGGASASGSNNSAGGGGGGEYTTFTFRASDLTSTVAVTIGTAGTAGTAGSAGGIGGTTTFGSYVTAYGGGGGAGGNAGGGGGGGGAGLMAAGTSGSGTSGGAGGAPLGGAGGNPGVGSNFGGGGGNNGSVGGTAGLSVFGGAGGDGGDATDSGGGKSIYGGGGGGGGGNSNGATSGGTSQFGGSGGNGGKNGVGTAGVAPGGGGGGTGTTSSAANNGGAGGRGECRVTTLA